MKKSYHGSLKLTSRIPEAAAAGVQRAAGVVGAVFEACLGPAFKANGWDAQLVLGAGHRGHGEATQHHSQVQ